MEKDYLQSLKRSILDYVLIDSEEQERLGLNMKKQVGWLSFLFYCYVCSKGDSEDYHNAGKLRTVVEALW